MMMTARLHHHDSNPTLMLALLVAVLYGFALGVVVGFVLGRFA